MSLRTAYTGGFDTLISTAVAAGEAFFTANKTAIQTALTTAAGLGKTVISYSAAVTYNPAGMILAGTVYNAFTDGVERSFIAEQIMSSQVQYSIAATDAITNTLTITITF
jgi:hypothetical protein